MAVCRVVRRAAARPSSVSTIHSPSRTTTVTMTGTPWARASPSDVGPSTRSHTSTTTPIRVANRAWRGTRNLTISGWNTKVAARAATTSTTNTAPARVTASASNTGAKRPEGLQSEHHAESHDDARGEREQHQQRYGEIAGDQAVRCVHGRAVDHFVRDLARQVVAAGVDHESFECVHAEQHREGPRRAVGHTHLDRTRRAGELDDDVDELALLGAERRADLDRRSVRQVDRECVDDRLIDG